MAYRSNRFGDDEDDLDDLRPKPQSKNPFDDEEDNPEDFGKSPELLRLQREKELLEQRMVDSSYRSVGMINESQQIANETAEDLKVQREKLERTNRNLDSMQDDLNQSDRNITSLKSLWGTMSNWFKKPVPPRTTPQSAGSDSPEQNGKDITGDVKGMDNEIQENLKKMDGIGNTPQSARGGTTGMQSRGQGSSIDTIVDNNLDQMLAGLSVLKQQGLALGSEIESQNVIIDDIYGKVDKTDTRITTQEAKIKKILKK